MNIQPNNQTVENCLRNRTYHIDFYQREYVWEKNVVNILLEDIFFTFDLAYEEHKEKDITPEVLAKYNWYYFNIYITNNIEGKEYIVDGQQRLTTLALIAIKLLELANKNEEFYKNLIDPLKACICGQDKFKGNIFWIDNEKRKRIMQHLINNENFTDEFENITEENINNRYKDISKYIDDKKLSKEKLQVLIMYFLERLVLVELKIEKDDTPMVFEVINDRGIALKPFEILKGKLIGALDKNDAERYSKIWEDAITQLRGIEDDFFIDYLKGKFIFKRNADIEKAINNQYHRYIFENNDIAKELKFRKKDINYIKNIKDFIKNNLDYYSKLYSKIRKNEFEYLSYNNDINYLSGQYQNIIAACLINDTKEQAKIETIAKEIDRLYMLLNLNGIYDSNNYQEISYQLNEDLHGAEINKYKETFNKIIEQRIKEARNLSVVLSWLDYDRFKTRGYDNIKRRPLRYFFARIEKYLCDNMVENMKDDVNYISTKTGYQKGYQIEHILSHNDENIKYFGSEEEFENQRNRLGGLLLLYNKDNSSSNNEGYIEKLKTYSNGLFWGRTLIDNFYHHTNQRFAGFNEDFKNKTGMEFKPFKEFDAKALECRSKLLFEIVKKIWTVDE